MMVPMSSVLLAVLFFVLGTVLGSFGNVVVLRGIKGLSLQGRSACPKCGRGLLAWELIPVISFFLVGRRCRTCRVPLSWQYPLVEAGTGCLFVAALVRHDFSAMPGALLGVCLWLLLLLSLYDGKTGFIPDTLSLPFMGVALLYAGNIHIVSWMAVAIGTGFFAVQWILTTGRGIGSGDILLAIGIGILVGSVQLLLLSLFISYIVGALFAITLLVRKKMTFKSALPFGPFLAFGAAVSVLVGQNILERLGL